MTYNVDVRVIKPDNENNMKIDIYKGSKKRGFVTITQDMFQKPHMNVTCFDKNGLYHGTGFYLTQNNIRGFLQMTYDVETVDEIMKVIAQYTATK